MKINLKSVLLTLFAISNSAFSSSIFYGEGDLRDISVQGNRPVSSNNIQFHEFKKLNGEDYTGTNLVIVTGSVGRVTLPDWKFATVGDITINGETNCLSVQFGFTGKLTN